MTDKTPLKIAFWGNAVLVTLMLLLDGEILQMCPFILFMGVTGAMIWGGKDYKVAAIIIAGLMALLNLSLLSSPDVIVWTLSLIMVIL